MTDHGAATIQHWLRELIENARSGRTFETSAGADPGRSYAYLEFHGPDGMHSVLLFRVDHEGDRPLVRAHRFEGSADEVRERMYELVPAEDRPQR
jgi:hypothetical protein